MRRIRASYVKLVTVQKAMKDGDKDTVEVPIPIVFVLSIFASALSRSRSFSHTLSISVCLVYASLSILSTGLSSLSLVFVVLR